jgi:hypothetical protein
VGKRLDDILHPKKIIPTAHIEWYSYTFNKKGQIVRVVYRTSVKGKAACRKAAKNLNSGRILKYKVTFDVVPMAVTGLVTINGYRHRSWDEKDENWLWENVVSKKDADDMTKDEKVIAWKYEKMGNTTRWEHLEKKFPTTSVLEDLAEHEEAFMLAKSEMRTFGAAFCLDKDFQDHLPGQEDEANLEIELDEDLEEEEEEPVDYAYERYDDGSVSFSGDMLED